MEYLKTSPEKLQQKAREIHEKADRIQHLTCEMFSTVDSFNGKVWSGEASTAYKNQFRELVDDAKRMRGITEELNVKLDMIARGYKIAEDKNVAKSNALADDVI